MAKQPNILIFYTDDQRFDTINALGNKAVITPNIDGLVASGTSFTHAHIPGGICGALCVPSRAMLMTGRQVFNLKDRGHEIPTSDKTMPECLMEAGYETFQTGKWHNDRASYARCFPEQAGRIFFGGMSDHFMVPLHAHDPSGAYEDEAKYFVEKNHSSDLFSNSAIEYLDQYAEEDREKPFFLYLPFTAPHDPRDTHPKYHAMYSADEIELPPNFMTEHPFDPGVLDIRDERLADYPRDAQTVKEHIAAYYAMITHLDDCIGNVIATLEKHGLREDTIIVFAGDNGLSVGQHALMGKQSVYEHSMRVPLIFSGPGIPENTVSNAYCYLYEIFPTVFDLLGLDTPDTLDGQSLLPAMQDTSHLHHETVYMAYDHLARAVKDREHKLIEYQVNGERTTLLFDLANDPFETNNLANLPEHQATKDRFQALLLAEADRLGDTPEKIGGGFWHHKSFKRS